MTKDEIVAHVSENAKVNKNEAERVIGVLTDLIIDELKAGRAFQLRDVGTLKPKHSEARNGRNPQTGAAMAIPAKQSAKLVPSTKLLHALAS